MSLLMAIISSKKDESREERDVRSSCLPVSYYFLTTNAIVATVGGVVVGVIIREMCCRGYQFMEKWIHFSRKRMQIRL